MNADETVRQNVRRFLFLGGDLMRHMDDAGLDAKERPFASRS